MFSYFNTLRVYDMIEFHMVFMFKVNNNLLLDHMLSYNERVCDSHNHTTYNRNTNYKIKCNTTYKMACMNTTRHAVRFISLKII